MSRYKGRRRSVMALLVCVAMFSACARETAEEAVSADAITLAEEIAAGTTETIPAEAYEYYALDYQIPEGFAATEGNTEGQAVYYSMTEGDYSYIAYERRDRGNMVTIRALTEEDYAAALTEGLGVDIAVTGFVLTEEDGIPRAEISYRYMDDGHDYTGTEVLYETGRFVFSIVYCMDSAFDWQEAFAQGVDALRLINVITEKEEAE